MGKTSSKVKDRWNKKAYDVPTVRVPKGGKALIESVAAQAGESLNEYINNAILKRMGYAEWPKMEIEPSEDE